MTSMLYYAAVQAFRRLRSFGLFLRSFEAFDYIIGGSVFLPLVGLQLREHSGSDTHMHADTHTCRQTHTRIHTHAYRERGR